LQIYNIIKRMRVPNPSRVRNSEKLSRLLLDLENPDYLVIPVAFHFANMLGKAHHLRGVAKFVIVPEINNYRFAISRNFGGRHIVNAGAGVADAVGRNKLGGVAVPDLFD